MEFHAIYIPAQFRSMYLYLLIFKKIAIVKNPDIVDSLIKSFDKAGRIVSGESTASASQKHIPLWKEIRDFDLTSYVYYTEPSNIENESTNICAPKLEMSRNIYAA